jgi:hypothetical protein
MHSSITNREYADHLCNTGIHAHDKELDQFQKRNSKREVALTNSISIHANFTCAAENMKTELTDHEFGTEMLQVKKCCRNSKVRATSNANRYRSSVN